MIDVSRALSARIARIREVYRVFDEGAEAAHVESADELAEPLDEFRAGQELATIAEQTCTELIAMHERMAQIRRIAEAGI